MALYPRDLFPDRQILFLYCRLIYTLSILCVTLTIKVKVGIPESFKVGWYRQKITGSSHLNQNVNSTKPSLGKCSLRTYIFKRWRSLAVPSAAPTIISAFNTSSTSIAVHWNPIPENLTNGILLGYRISYRPFSQVSLPGNITVNASSTSVELKGLQKFCFYLIIIFGYTKTGEGLQKARLGRTGEDGNYHNN